MFSVVFYIHSLCWHLHVLERWENCQFHSSLTRTPADKQHKTLAFKHLWKSFYYCPLKEHLKWERTQHKILAFKHLRTWNIYKVAKCQIFFYIRHIRDVLQLCWNIFWNCVKASHNVLFTRTLGEKQHKTRDSEKQLVILLRWPPNKTALSFMFFHLSCFLMLEKEEKSLYVCLSTRIVGGMLIVFMAN